MLTIEVTQPGSPAATAIVTAYLTHVASRYYGRAATMHEVSRALLDEPFDDLAGSTGTFLTAVEDGAVIACAGARYLDDMAELTKVFTLPSARGQGVGTRLIAEIEVACRARGIRILRLDTRAELAEACALYERLGFSRVEAFNDGPYSDRWYAKELQPEE